MGYDLVVKGGLVVTPTGTLHADVAIAGERIAAIGARSRRRARARRERALRDPGRDRRARPPRRSDLPAVRESRPPTRSRPGPAPRRSAARRPSSTSPSRRSGSRCSRSSSGAARDADGEAVIDYALHMNLRDPDPARAREIPGVVARGVPSFKLYMAYEGYRIPDAAILRAMTALAAEGGLAVLHAENDDVIEVLHAPALAAEGRTGPAWLAAACPPEARGARRCTARSCSPRSPARACSCSTSPAAKRRARSRWAKRARARRWPARSPRTASRSSSRRCEPATPRAQSLAVRPPLRDGAQRARAVGGARRPARSTSSPPTTARGRRSRTPARPASRGSSRGSRWSTRSACAPG